MFQQLNEDFKQLAQSSTNVLHTEQTNQVIWDSLIYVEQKSTDSKAVPQQQQTTNTSSAISPKTTKHQFYVRAEFDYDPARDPSFLGDSGLTFRRGDILYVINAADDSWWQAKRVTNEQENEDEIGIIPSKSHVEKRERARQKRLSFNQSQTLDREKKIKRKFSFFHKTDNKKEQKLDTESVGEPIPSYEIVTQHEIDYTRPVIIFGPLNQILNDQLIDDRPNQFATCVPHTSRPKRATEVDGREYYFVPTYEQMRRDIQNYLYIEAGEYRGNLYGTPIAAVREVANAGKHCILDVSGHAIQRLISAGLYPIVIYVKARNIKWILNNMEENANKESAQQMFDKANKIEQEFGENFTTTVEEETLDDVYNRICEIIDREAIVTHVWIPSNDKL